MNAEVLTTSVTPFDSIAEQYDNVFEENIVTKEIRSIVWKSLLKNFKSGDRILELNCGTGTDALMLAEHGMNITAIDASEKMIQEARRKEELREITSVEFLTMNFHEIDKLQGQQFNGAFSNFGGLNCTNNLETVLKSISNLLKPNSSFVVCLMNKICLWEMFGFLARGKLSQAFRRFHKDGVEARVGDSSVHTCYYSPNEFAIIISPWFTVEKIYGLNIFSPNPNSRSFVVNHPRLTQRLLKFDNTVRSAFPFHTLGDHFVIEARRK